MFNGDLAFSNRRGSWRGLGGVLEGVLERSWRGLGGGLGGGFGGDFGGVLEDLGGVFVRLRVFKLHPPAVCDPALRHFYYDFYIILTS